MEIIIVLAPLILGYLLDLCLGDPRWLPHPIRFYGHLIAYGEKKLNKGPFLFYKGTILSFSLTICSFIFFYITDKLAQISPIASVLFLAVFVFYSLANKSLIDEGKAVFKALQKGLDEGRSRLSWIVGRETKKLSSQQVKTAVFETLSENLSDGVIAPLFFYAVLGVPGAMMYKMINTLDSMIGYKNDRYEKFGKFAAKLDDIFNYIPARITAFLMLLVTFKLNRIPFVLKYGKQHASPNSGYPEAALAAILNCRFGGPNYYHNKLVNKPYIGENNRLIHENEINRVVKINQKVTFIFVFIITAIHYYILC